ncbi:MAG: hypothetical protein A3G08_00385 [Candidatus Magasanikbacteria bacterium RIFCSPLOWO2_12_FULL_47_9b]|nr:MAG: hypothetical protein A3I74_04235 [Candidatus Magasanikbacteria bacterium RIFCSPLOWO2_02_FULL_47_16]OGH79367.1 MAG: hypothetical protein A3C10_04775 [Candidatus Magasanikbacteria bacterium RIFCSPHIGHO2_02_FULL_48_18]OGH83519.1 MAG: hypothetical protein A3G08_00385 [Candidatus Magasanikbacteria bacterium RIFCSPLOWO2_12_FULL_47_9b]
MSWYTARLHPKIYEPSYLTRKQIKNAIQKFIHTEIGSKKEYTIVDLGCGDAPYKSLFHNYAKYIGVDIEAYTDVDIVAKMWDIPLPDNSVDFLLSTEVIEHSEKPKETIAEICRILKPGGKALLTIPFLYPLHGSDDRWRFTIHGLSQLMGEEKKHTCSIRPSNGFFITYGQLFNVLLMHIPFGRYFYPISFPINCVSLASDWLFKQSVFIMRPFVTKEQFSQIRKSLLESFPIRYIVTITK